VSHCSTNDNVYRVVKTGFKVIAVNNLKPHTYNSLEIYSPILITFLHLLSDSDTIQRKHIRQTAPQ